MNYIETKNAPAAIGPYSQAVVFGGLIYTSGNIRKLRNKITA